MGQGDVIALQATLKSTIWWGEINKTGLRTSLSTHDLSSRPEHTMPSPSIILHRLQVVSRLLLRRMYAIMVWLNRVDSIHFVFYLIELTLEPSILNGWPHFEDLLLLELVELVDFLSCNVLVMLTVYISFIIKWVPRALYHLGDDDLALFYHFVKVFMLELLSGYLCGATDLILRCVALNNWIVPDVA